jgi:N-acyl-D-aspartate/D-glutamate deacylase
LLAACQPALDADYLIINGDVFIGDNTPSKQYNLALKDDEIIYVGKERAVKAEQTIDANGLYVLPGFIDPHTHSMGELKSDKADIRQNKNYLTQGVTTVFNGNDGFGAPDVAADMAALSQAGIGTNTALFIGHGALRKSVMGGAKRAPTEAEMKEMKTAISQGMQTGALGLSTGLFYAPGSFSETEEVIELAKVVAEYGGVYDSHIRDEASYNIGLQAAVEEVIEISRGANIPANIAHIKALGVDVWGQSETLIETIEQAQADGLKITADQYPWQASGTRISNALLPSWVKAGTQEEYMQRLNNQALRERIFNETAENLRKRGGPEAVLITQNNSDWQGQTLGQLSKKYALSAVDMAIKIAREGDARIASFNMNPDDIERFMVQDWVMTSSDGSTGHPRKYASYPQKYRKYVTDRKLMPVETFFYRSSGLVAETFGVCDRGYLKVGYKADIAIIDPDKFYPKASFENSAVLSEGVTHLFVNGQPAITDGQAQAVLSGQVLKRCNSGRETYAQ